MFVRNSRHRHVPGLVRRIRYPRQRHPASPLRKRLLLGKCRSGFGVWTVESRGGVQLLVRHCLAGVCDSGS